MRIENTLNIFASMIYAVSYVALLVAFTLLEEQRMTYIFIGLTGLILATVLLGFAKLLNYQEKIHEDLSELIRVQRISLRTLNDTHKLLQNVQKNLPHNTHKQSTAKKPAIAES